MKKKEERFNNYKKNNFLTNLWPDENVVDREHGDDSQHLVGAAHFSSRQQDLGLDVQI